MPAFPRPSALLASALALCATSLPLFAFAPAPFQGGGNVIYDNGSHINVPGGGFGGADLSMYENLTLGHSTTGFGAGLPNRVIDEFTVPGGQLWYIDRMRVYAFVPLGSPPSINNAALQIWNGAPNLSTSSVIYGDLTTNRWMGLTSHLSYRAPEDSPNSTFLGVGEIEIRVGALFPPGTYWLDFGINVGMIPPVSVRGQNVTGNALLYNRTFSPPFFAWSEARMSVGNPGVPTHPQGIPFKLVGSVACCWESELGTNLNHGDDTITNGLGLAFPFPLPGTPLGGATTSTVSVCSNGFVGLGGSFSADFTPTVSEFLSLGARIAVPWNDYVPASGFAPQRQVWFSSRPDRAIITWRRVPTFQGGPSLSMLQLQMFPSGAFFVNVWNHEPTTPRTPIFGVSAGANAASAAIDMSEGHVGTLGTATIYQSFASGTSDLSGSIFCFNPKRNLSAGTYDITRSDACCNEADNLAYGAGCAGLALSSTLPLAGQSFVLTLTGTTPTTGAAVLAFGVTQTTMPIEPLLAPGCDLLHGLEFPGALPLDPLNPSLALPIPCNAAFFGHTLYVQGLALDPAANALGLAVSNGVALTIGND
ncbi:MAG: hypothetical protein JNM84_15310 [Planctomycetes bacterium]|nr:hypothetical protein [Planctomycetota bacterium]